MKHHDSLSSLSVLIDARFTVKLSGYGRKRLLPILDRTPAETKYGETTLWEAPEELTRECTTGSRFADVYSLGVLIGEILTGITPYGIDIHDPAHVASKGPKF